MYRSQDFTKLGQRSADFGEQLSDQVAKMGERFGENMARAMRLGDVAGLGNLSGVFERCSAAFAEQLGSRS